MRAAGTRFGPRRPSCLVDTKTQLDDLTNESLFVLIAMRLMQGAPHQMTTDDPGRIKEAMALAMHLGGSWVEKGKGIGVSPRAIVLLPPPRDEAFRTTT